MSYPPFRIGFDSRITCNVAACYYRLRLHLTLSAKHFPRSLPGDRPGNAETVSSVVEVPPSLMGQKTREIRS